MNKIMKFAPIILVLVLFAAAQPVCAVKYIDTHIQGLHDVTVHQGEKFTLHIKILEENGSGICWMDTNSVHLSIYDSNQNRVYYYTVVDPRAWGNDITVDTSKLQPGTYEMTANFDGDYDSARIKQFRGCSESATLTVLPNNSLTPYHSKQ